MTFYFLLASALCFCSVRQAEDGASALVVSGCDGVCVRPHFLCSVSGQLHLLRPDQQGKDTGRSKDPTPSSIIFSFYLFSMTPINARQFYYCSRFI